MPFHLLLVDASGFAHRSYHVANPVYRDSDGQPIGAVLGFADRLWRMLGAAEADRPSHAAAIFDPPTGTTFRHKLFPAYKGNRDPARAFELYDQLPFMKLIADAMGLHTLEVPGYEADDVIATLAKMAAKEGWRTTIVSSDKDMHQLVRDDVVEIVDPMSKVRIREADVLKRWGVPARLVADVQALAGDMVDNYPGVKGIGLDKAAKMVRAHGSVAKILKNIPSLPPHFMVPVRRHAKVLPVFLRLARLHGLVRLPVGLGDLVLEPYERARLLAILRKLEAEKRYTQIFEGAPAPLAVAIEPIADPFDWWRGELLCPGQQVPETPQCGFYEMRLAPGAVPVPVKVWREPELAVEDGEPTGRELLCCTINSVPKNPSERWGRFCANPVTEARFKFLTADKEWAEKYKPDDPVANPHKPVNFNHLPAPTFAKRKTLK